MSLGTSTALLVIPQLLGLIIILPLLIILCAAVPLPPWNDDVLGLTVFKQGVQDPQSALSSWSQDDLSPCNWTGVECDPSDGRVIGIALDDLSLSGHIGRGFFKLDKLKSLSLSRNNLSGFIDSEIAALGLLNYLDLSHNSLSGGIPGELGNLTSLRLLDLSDNLFTGLISPDLFGACYSLQSIILSENLLEGSIPVSIGNCKELLSLDLSYNRLNGTIPSAVGSLSRLKHMDLSSNDMSGQLTPHLGSLQNLESLFLQNNGFSEGIPPQLDGCVSLRVLDLSNNFLSQALPATFYSLNKMLTLRLHRNSLSGWIPSWIGNLTGLQELDLASNRFVGEIPDSISFLSSLQRLSLSENELSGYIPSTISLISNLQILDLSNNSFVGPLRSELFSLQSLQSLVLYMNRLSGELPPIAPGNCASLQALDLSSNRFVGTIPAQISQCSDLRFISLSTNMLSGEIPSALQISPRLQSLDLSSNQLEGSIPNIFLNASSLLHLNLADNALQGQIPATIFESTTLSDLDLSANLLSGRLPSVLANLLSLERLDLSWNNFSGTIPQNLVQLHNLSTFNISHNRLRGEIPSNGSFSRFNSSSFSDNAGLCGSIVNVPCQRIPLPIVAIPNSVGAPSSGTESVPHRKQKVLTILTLLAIVAAAVIALGIAAAILLNLRTRARSVFTQVKGHPAESLPVAASGSEGLSIAKLVMFTEGMEPRSNELLPNANVLLNKDCEIGSGVYGIVYKAVLAHGRTVAAKKLTAEGLVQSQAKFEKEIHILGRVQHPNVVSLQGYCWTPKLPYIFYDFIPHGSLYRRLHERAAGEPPLTWRQRFRIVVGAASGLAYLHHDCHPRIIHCAVNSSNVLLDEDFHPRISDYGLAKLFPKMDRPQLSSQLQKSRGYLAPECAHKNFKMNEKCEIYAFGVILLELVTGRKAVECVQNDVLLLPEYVQELMDHGESLMCIDPMLESYPEDEVMPVIRLGLICTSHRPSKRPSLSEVVQVMDLIKPLGDDSF
ncbi:hypothetical protein O6H91_02G058000 [Diphasiastrum complanatum]|uniref:Uncharacterized protein n=2 Tax=Diphasiastrum complanatum TaxID=34168 RepID=A0ACC2EFY3_DIPCM|nr:hypothetical protein O6H91_02G058000 [Diphasiastrum complanatum]KAJ7565378.1 hypothetical protein O6H91_02G058000 [Diphasiastrum complanatum]